MLYSLVPALAGSEPTFTQLEILMDIDEIADIAIRRKDGTREPENWAGVEFGNSSAGAVVWLICGGPNSTCPRQFAEAAVARAVVRLGSHTSAV